MAICSHSLSVYITWGFELSCNTYGTSPTPLHSIWLMVHLHGYAAHDVDLCSWMFYYLTQTLTFYDYRSYSIRALGLNKLHGVVFEY